MTESAPCTAAPAGEDVESLRSEACKPERYQIRGEHGRGATGRVSRALDRKLGRDIAIGEPVDQRADRLVDTGEAHGRGAVAHSSTSAPFLEKRVPEELATEGVVLSRRNLALQLEQVGTKWLVSLVDLTTGRVAASTRVDVLPADREAAVAAMTHVVSDLAAQIIGRAEAPPPPPVAVAPAAPPPPPPAVIDDRAERERREIAELKFRRQELRFGNIIAITATGNVMSMSRRWTVHQGDLDQELEPQDFYAEIGRPDLGEAYTQRRRLAIGGYIVGGSTLVAGLLLGTVLRKECSIDLPESEFSTCLDDNTQTFLISTAVGVGVGLVGLGVGLWYSLHPHPISENDAKGLADVYNQRLRRELGLPVVMREPLLHDVTLAPLLVRGEARGLALTARF